MSREVVATAIADQLITMGLNQVYGVNVSKSTYRSGHWSITFCTARTLDGVVNYYGPKFVQVKFQTAYRALPRNGNRVYTSVEDALKFIRLAFVDFNFDAAEAVPTKPSK